MGKILNRKTGIIVGAILLCLIIAYLIRINFSSRTIQAFVTPLEVRVNEPVFYSDSTRRARQWLWDFGNGETTDESSGSYVYKIPGKYQIKLLVDRKYEKKILVTVLPEKNDDKDTDLVKIIAPEVAVQGEYVIFRGVGNDKEWRWEFGETGNIDSRDRNPIYTYNNPGIYEVLLTTEKTRYPIRHIIEVFPRYMENDSTDVFVLVGNDIKEKLQAIVDGKPFNSNYNYIMSKYLCNNSEALVIINNTKRNDFYSYCQGLKITGRKKTIIDNVIVDVDTQTGECVRQLTVTQYDK